MRLLIAGCTLALMCVRVVGAGNSGVAPSKLSFVVKLAPVSKAKVVYVARTTTAGTITKGAGSDINQIGARLDVAYVGTNGSTVGAFIVPVGAGDGTAGWVTNGPTIAKFVNSASPSGPSNVKTAVIRPGRSLKLVAKGTGDIPLDIWSSGEPVTVFTSYCVANAGASNCHCSRLTGCVLRIGKGGSVATLVCKTSVPDATCHAGPPPTCGNAGIEPGETCDGQYFPDTASPGHAACRDSGPSLCTFCGDGIVQTAAGEQCDDGNSNELDGCAGCLERVCGDGGNPGPCPAGTQCIHDYTANTWACMGDDPTCGSVDLGNMCVCASSLPAGIMDGATCGDTCHNAACDSWCCPGGCAGYCRLCNDSFGCITGQFPCASGTICVPSGVPWG